jgi:hypothetical protein
MYKVQYATCDVRRAICVAVSLVAASVVMRLDFDRKSIRIPYLNTEYRNTPKSSDTLDPPSEDGLNTQN